MWWVWLGCGAFSFIGFWVVALRVRNRKYSGAAVIATVSSAIALGASLIWPPAETSKSTGADASSDSLASTTVTWVVMAVWVGLIAYGYYLNHDYKKFLAAEDEQNLRQWHATRAQVQALYEPGGVPAAPAFGASVPAPNPPPPPAGPPVDPLIEQADQYLATQPPGSRPGPLPPNAPGT
jgi:hypothetical protein